MGTEDGEIVKRLVKGRSLAGLGLETADGKWVVRGIHFEQPKAVAGFVFRSMPFSFVTGETSVRRKTWRDISFQECDFSNVSFFGARLENCVFERCRCRSIGFWNSTLSGCRFQGSDLRDAALGGILREWPKPNLYSKSVFERTDFRGSAHSCEAYDSCEFLDCKLDGVDFMGSIFERCVFSGTLNETRFRGYDPSCSGVPRNRMAGCNFKKARLRWSDFLYIDVDRSMFGDDPDLIFLPHGPQDWLEWLQAMGPAVSEGKRLFVKLMSESAGTPSLALRSSMTSAFTQEEIQSLIDIASGSSG